MNAKLQTYVNSKNMIRRFNSLALAQSFLAGSRYGNVTPILMGDDGKFWVCSSPRRAYQLIEAGYEEA